MTDHEARFREAYDSLLQEMPDPPSYERVRIRRLAPVVTPRRASVAAMAMSLTVIALAGGLLFLLGSVTEEPNPTTAATSPGASSSTPTNTAEQSVWPLGRLVFSEQTDSVLVFDDGRTGVISLDLDGGDIARHEIEGQRPGDQPHRLTRVGDSLLVGWGDIYRVSINTLESTRLGDATIYLPAVEADTVWLIEWAGGRIGQGAATYRMVNMDGVNMIEAPGLDREGSYPTYGIPGGLVHETASDLTLWYPNDDPVDIPASSQAAVIDVAGDLVAWCENPCSTLTLTNTQGQSMDVESPDSAKTFVWYGAQFSPDGEFLAAIITDAEAAEQNRRGSVVLIDASSGETTVIAEDLAPYLYNVAWSPDGHDLFFMSDSYSRSETLVGWYRLTDGHLEVTTLPFGGALSFVVLDRDEAAAFLTTTPAHLEPLPHWSVDGIGVAGGTGFWERGSLVLRDLTSVFVADGNGLMVTALELATGEPVWQKTVDDGGVVVLLGASSDTVFVGGYGLVVALERATGVELWRWVDPSGQLRPTAAYTGAEAVHILLSRPTEGDTEPPVVMTFDRADGSVVWSRPLDGTDHSDLDIQPGLSSSALIGDRLFVKTTGAMHALDARSGEILWIHRFAAVPYEGYNSAPLLVDGELLYVPDPDGELVALEADSGRQRWHLEVERGPVAPVAIHGGHLVFVDGAGAHAVDPATGDPIWGQPMPVAHATLVNDILVVFAGDQISGLDANTGNALWSVAVDLRGLPYAVLAANGVAVAAAEDGIVAIRADTGEIVWKLSRGAAEPPIIVDDSILLAHPDDNRTVALYPISPD